MTVRFAVSIAAMTATLLAGAARAEPVALKDASGPLAAVMEDDPAFPGRTVYRPADLKAVKGKLPLVVFGNGGCANVGNSYQTLLAEFASRGYLAVAPGPIDPAWMNGPPPPGQQSPVQSKPGHMAEAMDLAAAADKSGPWAGRIDLARIAVAGQSCGGLEAINAGGDPRVKTVLILNSGVIRGGIPNPDGTTRQPRGYLPASASDLARLHTPIAYLVGGPTDQAFAASVQDFKDITQPAFHAALPVGHGGTWRQPHAGEMGTAAVAWLDWTLKGDAKAGALFTGADCGLCRNPQWTVNRKGMN